MAAIRNDKMDNKPSIFRRYYRTVTYFIKSRFLPQIFRRAFTANLLMVLFIVLIGIGTFMIWPPVGFIAAGVACGIYGFILGLE